MSTPVSESHPVQKSVRIWLLAGLIMVFFQVVIGGVTRLTDSGLSITEWAVIQGTIPPLNDEAWQQAFDQYKEAARKQYESLHADMTLSEFKVIFFWEYFHRLWARLMGLVFLFPFLYFWSRKWLPRWLMRRLGVVILLAVLAAAFGMIMVASGLNDDSRTWVSAYKLIIHLGIATALFGYLFWTWLLASQPPPEDGAAAGLRRFGWGLAAVLIVQILFGGLMAGMRAGLLHPYFPFFVEGGRLLDALSSTSGLGFDHFIDYEPSTFVKALVQVLHRATAYLLAGLVVWFFIRIRRSADRSSRLLAGSWWLFGAVALQFLLGVLTVVNSIGRIPIFYGVVHQAGALLLLIALLFVNFQFRNKPLPS